MTPTENARAEQEGAETDASAPAGVPPATDAAGDHGAASVVRGLEPDGGTSDEGVEVLPDLLERLRTEDLDKGPPPIVLAEQLFGGGEGAAVFGDGLGADGGGASPKHERRLPNAQGRREGAGQVHL